MYIFSYICVENKNDFMDALQLKINVEFDQLLEIVKQLSPSEKVTLNEFIWDSEYEIPNEHQQIVLDRMAKSKTDPNCMLDWETALRKLKL